MDNEEDETNDAEDTEVQRHVSVEQLEQTCGLTNIRGGEEDTGET